MLARVMIAKCLYGYGLCVLREKSCSAELRLMSHLQFSLTILSCKCGTKSRDKVASICVQHSVNRVAQNRAELYSEIELCDC